MLTRLKVSGFKNLVDTEVRFGPFTCIAGFNGVGKSNLFDAIRFLSLLADHPFAEAARLLRGGTDIRDLFTAGGGDVMSFECDMIIPRSGFDEVMQTAEATRPYLTYRLKLRLQASERQASRVEVLEEHLEGHRQVMQPSFGPISPSQGWLASVVSSLHSNGKPFQGQSSARYIYTHPGPDEEPSTLGSIPHRVIYMRLPDRDVVRAHSRPQKRSRRVLAFNAPRTVLSLANYAEETPDSVLARVEMRSWRLLQFEPSALRQPDSLDAPSNMDLQGHHLPATLARLADGDDGQTYARIANRLAEVVESVREVRVDRDDVRRSLQLQLVDRAGAVLPASLLSDGTLRFIALSALELDPELTGVVCLEEPENGLHPQRVSAMLDLLKAMAVDTGVPVGPDNPLRQVIISTHSPVVVAQMHPDDVLFADHRDAPSLKPGRLRALTLRPMAGTWRAAMAGNGSVSIGQVVSYLGAMRPQEPDEEDAGDNVGATVYAVAELVSKRIKEQL